MNRQGASHRGAWQGAMAVAVALVPPHPGPLPQGEGAWAADRVLMHAGLCADGASSPRPSPPLAWRRERRGAVVYEGFVIPRHEQKPHEALHEPQDSLFGFERLVQMLTPWSNVSARGLAHSMTLRASRDQGTLRVVRDGRDGGLKRTDRMDRTDLMRPIGAKGGGGNSKWQNRFAALNSLIRQSLGASQGGRRIPSRRRRRPSHQPRGRVCRG